MIGRCSLIGRRTHGIRRRLLIVRRTIGRRWSSVRSSCGKLLLLVVLCAIVAALPARQNAQVCTSSPAFPSSECFGAPVPDLSAPLRSYQNTADDVHEPDDQCEEAAPFFSDRKGDRFDIEFDEDAWDVVFGNLVRLLCDCVLVRENRTNGGEQICWRGVGNPIGGCWHHLC